MFTKFDKKAAERADGERLPGDGGLGAEQRARHGEGQERAARPPEGRADEGRGACPFWDGCVCKICKHIAEISNFGSIFVMKSEFEATQKCANIV